MSRHDESARHGDGERLPVGADMVRPTLTVDVATLVYDGECAFCRRCAQWVKNRRRAPRVVAYQSSPLADWGLTLDECERAVQWLGSSRAEGAPAIAATLVHLGMPWSWTGRVIAAPGVRRLAALVYARVAARRRCATPPLA